MYQFFKTIIIQNGSDKFGFDKTALKLKKLYLSKGSGFEAHTLHLCLEPLKMRKTYFAGPQKFKEVPLESKSLIY